MARVSEWQITAHRMLKKTFTNRIRSLCESRLSKVKTCASVYATSDSVLLKVVFESHFWKRTYSCVKGYLPARLYDSLAEQRQHHNFVPRHLSVVHTTTLSDRTRHVLKTLLTAPHFNTIRKKSTTGTQ